MSIDAEVLSIHILEMDALQNIENTELAISWYNIRTKELWYARIFHIYEVWICRYRSTEEML